MESFQNYLDRALPEVDFEDTKDSSSLFKTLTYARESVGMTQEQLSKKSGIPQSFISLIENGKANPSIKVLKKLAEGLGMRLIIDFE